MNDPLEHLVDVLRYHPHYLKSFLDTHRYLLYGNGPLPYDCRHYISIMAAARNRCSYLVNAESALFLMHGGDKKWLLGLEHVPRKLRNLSEINKLLAHRPWLLKPTDIAMLTKGPGPKDNWSISELTHALVLLAHFHALSSFVHGCGISNELDIPRSRSSSGSTNDSSALEGAPFSNGLDSAYLGIEELMEKMELLSEEPTDEMSPEDIADRLVKVENLTIELMVTCKQRSAKADLYRYVEDTDFTYLDFARQNGTGADGQRVQTFLIQDFTWEDQGYSLADRLYMEVAALLDNKFNIAQQLTYYSCGKDTEVDPTTFRRAMWNFIHCIYGIRHDDYDYSVVSQILEKNLLSYIKVVACYPDTMSRTDYSCLAADFSQSEKVHINIMILEARMQSELLYGLRAISKHMTS